MSKRPTGVTSAHVVNEDPSLEEEPSRLLLQLLTLQIYIVVLIANLQDFLIWGRSTDEQRDAFRRICKHHGWGNPRGSLQHPPPPSPVDLAV